MLGEPGGQIYLAMLNVSASYRGSKSQQVGHTTLSSTGSPESQSVYFIHLNQEGRFTMYG